MLRLLLDLLEWEELLLLILLAGREADRLREPFSFASATSPARPGPLSAMAILVIRLFVLSVVWVGKG